MTTTTSGFVGHRLVEARLARGMSATDLAGLVGVSAVSISKYENGHQMPKLEVFHRLAGALAMPRPYFLRPVSFVDEKPVFWRGRLSVPAVKRDRAAIRLEWMKEIVDYVAQYFDFPELDLPSCSNVEPDDITTDDLRAIASEIRSHWGVRSGPMPDVLEKLEASGVLVSRITIGAEKLDAFSQWSDRFGIPFVVLSRDKASAVRQRFDALHELSHIILHKNISLKRLNDKAFYTRVERQADQLAGFLLLPEREFADELFAPSLDGFVTLKERWGASVGAMIMRCRAMDILSEDAARSMWINYNRRGWRDGEPLDSTLEKEAPYMLRRSFEKLLEAKVQTAADILSALPIPAAEIEEIADLDAGTLSGAAEPRPEPVFKEPFRQEDSNVVSIFPKRAN
jgi:Zn-dependent peptidase ImmA (M78 family)/transcriptional regulator with XRE-family HTH domain